MKSKKALSQMSLGELLKELDQVHASQETTQQELEKIQKETKEALRKLNDK